MEHNLPLEIIMRILYQVIETAIISNPQHSAHLALVCKLFQKWVTPLLYRDVAIRGEKAFERFLETTTSNPSLGRSVSGIWMEPLHNEVCKSTVEDEESRLRIEKGLVRIFSCTPHLKRLALINLEEMPLESWREIEEALPSGLEYLAAGPEHNVEFTEPNRFPSLKWLCSIDTQLAQYQMDTLLEMKQMQDFHWCFIWEYFDLRSVRCITHLLASSRPWNICLYLIEGKDNICTKFSKDVEIELVKLCEDKRVKKYQLFNHVDDWIKTFFTLWTEDWARSHNFR